MTYTTVQIHLFFIERTASGRNVPLHGQNVPVRNVRYLGIQRVPEMEPKCLKRICERCFSVCLSFCPTVCHDSVLRRIAV